MTETRALQKLFSVADIAEVTRRSSRAHDLCRRGSDWRGG